MPRQWPKWLRSPIVLLLACMAFGDAALIPWTPRWFHFTATAIALTLIGFGTARICYWVGRNPHNPSIKTSYVFAVAVTVLTAFVCLDHKVASISFLASFWLTMWKTPWLAIAKKQPTPRRVTVGADGDPPYAA